MKKLIYISILFCLSGINLNAQNSFKYRIKPETVVGMQLSQSLYGLGFTNYVAPRFTVDVTQKISAYVSAGAFSSTLNVNNSDAKLRTAGFYTQAGVMAQINPKLMVYGDVLFGNYNFSGTKNTIPDLNFRQITVGAEYKVSKNFSVGVQVTQTDNSNAPIKNKYDY
ncbi:MAG TPA: hypothetical protein DCQ31_14530 [Bacteroidales bacterium]|nr:hypothetical protein [Bacteroidales bacterium]